jgi:aryl-alcohol dehydrogenase-like predicted oxidoreductase
MMMGSKNNEAESFEILDRAFEAGIDFYDTAEIYPVPPKAAYVNSCETIVGKWLQTKPRDAVVLATKVTGPSHGWFKAPVRSEHSAIDRVSIRRAIEGSLKRLQVDHIDLYQVHWPDHDFGYEEILSTLTDLQRAGLIRAFGSSNESPWGTMKAQATAERLGTNRYETIQNNFSILNRRFEDSLADICRREAISCLPYSPLAGGVCTGKYNAKTPPEGARFTEYMKSQMQRQEKMANRFVNEKSLATVAELKKLADKYELGLTPMCLAWSKQHDFVASTIFGAVTLAQLEECLQAADLILPDELLKEIDAVTTDIPYPLG